MEELFRINSPEELARSSDLIIVGKVVGPAAGVDLGELNIVTDTTVQVECTLKGTAYASILKVRTDGGCVVVRGEQTCMIVSHGAQLTVGQRMVLFLTPDQDFYRISAEDGAYQLEGEIATSARFSLPLQELIARITSTDAHQSQAGTQLAPHIPTPIGFPGDFQLTLSADPMEGSAPLIVRLSANLIGGPENSCEIYRLVCADMSWDFGDGTVGEVEMPPCEPYTTEFRAPRRFFTGHRYERAGTYKASFELGEGEYSLQSNLVPITVR